MRNEIRSKVTNILKHKILTPHKKKYKIICWQNTKFDFGKLLCI